MKWPAHSIEIAQAGYKCTGRGNCSACGRPLLWLETPTAAADGRPRRMPVEPVGKPDRKLYQPHWATCEFADQFRPKPKTDPRQQSLFETSPTPK